jgi:hypothetical protein
VRKSELQSICQKSPFLSWQIYLENCRLLCRKEPAQLKLAVKCDGKVIGAGAKTAISEAEDGMTSAAFNRIKASPGSKKVTLELT